MKHILIVHVAVFSLLMAIPLSKQTVQQPKHLIFKPVKAKVAAIAVAKALPPAPTPLPAPAPTPPPPPAPLPQPVPKPLPAPIAYPSGSHQEWALEAGIAATNFEAVNYIISRESGWNPNATEPVSGAHGLPQALPYSKTGCGWVDAICQLRWANSYALTKYGGWWAAQAYWQNHHNW